MLECCRESIQAGVMKSCLTQCRDHSIVSSDSLGNVVFWDGASLAQKQGFTAHKADAMCLVIGPVSWCYL